MKNFEEHMSAAPSAPIYSQFAPYPTALAELVKTCEYRPGWTVEMRDRVRDVDRDGGTVSRGLTVIITTIGYNSYHIERGQTYKVQHYFPVPPATFDNKSWRRWLFDRFLDVETHECMEYFTIDGVKPYAPVHAPGQNPYTIREMTTDEDRRTSSGGMLNV